MHGALTEVIRRNSERFDEHAPLHCPFGHRGVVCETIDDLEQCAGQLGHFCMNGGARNCLLTSLGATLGNGRGGCGKVNSTRIAGDGQCFFSRIEGGVEVTGGD